jgi:hypothetical protein
VPAALDRALLGGPSTSPLDAMSGRVVFALIASLACFAQASAWEPHNVSAEYRDETSTDAFKRIDFLTPGPPTVVSELQGCLASYEVRPSFKPTQQWCLRQDGGRYLLGSLESRDANTIEANEASRSEVELPADVAWLIREIWLNAILEAHCPRFSLQGADGET